MFKDGCLFALIGLLLVIFLYAFSGLVLWGIGSLLVYAFEMDFQFTYLMGLALALILSVVGSFFKK